MKGKILKKVLVVGIIVLFISFLIALIINGLSFQSSKNEGIKNLDLPDVIIKKDITHFYIHPSMHNLLFGLFCEIQNIDVVHPNYGVALEIVGELYNSTI